MAESFLLEQPDTLHSHSKMDTVTKQRYQCVKGTVDVTCSTWPRVTSARHGSTACLKTSKDQRLSLLGGTHWWRPRYALPHRPSWVRSLVFNTIKKTEELYACAAIDWLKRCWMLIEGLVGWTHYNNAFLQSPLLWFLTHFPKYTHYIRKTYMLSLLFMVLHLRLGIEPNTARATCKVLKACNGVINALKVNR